MLGGRSDMRKIADAERLESRRSRCVATVAAGMVRSTLPQLVFRGALRAFFGGPLVSLFFRLQPKVFPIKNPSRKKSFLVSNVLDYENSHGNHYFSVRARDLPGHDHFWTTFWDILERKHEKSMKFMTNQIKSQK